MTTVIGRQFIYTSVEEPYSPRRRPGFQMVYWSHGLDDGSLAAIASRVQCFHCSADERERLQFFSLPQADVVLTRTVPIPSDRTIIDRSGRSGAFLCRGLVLDRNEFEAAEADPFVILDAFTAIRDATTMVELLGAGGGVVEPLELTLGGDDRRNVTQGWSGGEIEKLVASARAAEALRAQHQGLLVVGGIHQIESALRLALWFTEPSLRLACSFDTHIEKCKVAPGALWAAGNPVVMPASGRVHVDANACRVDGDNVPPAGDDRYASWLRTSLEDVSKAAHLARDVQWLACGLRGVVQQPKRVSEDAARSFHDCHPGYVRECLVNRLTGFSKELTKDLIAFAVRSGTKKDLLEWAAVSTSVETCHLCRLWLLASHDRSLSKADGHALSELAHQCKDHVLAFLVAVLRSNKDAAVRDAALEAMSDNDFETLLHAESREWSPSKLLSSRFVARLTSAKSLKGMRPGEIVDVFESIIEGGYAQALEETAPCEALRFLDRAGKKELKSLSRRLAKLSEALPASSLFQAELKSRLMLWQGERWSLSSLWRRSQ